MNNRTTLCYAVEQWERMTPIRQARMTCRALEIRRSESFVRVQIPTVLYERWMRYLRYEQYEREQKLVNYTVYEIKGERLQRRDNAEWRRQSQEWFKRGVE